jgi:predicted nucleotidyltransferase
VKNAECKIDPALLDELVRRIREVVEPVRIILFGSAARGETGPDSDLDVLVVVPEGHRRRDIAGDIYMNLIGFGHAVDVVVATEEDLRRYGDNFSLVYYPALREGRDIYAARPH